MQLWALLLVIFSIFCFCFQEVTAKEAKKVAPVKKTQPAKKGKKLPKVQDDDEDDDDED